MDLRISSTLIKAIDRQDKQVARLKKRSAECLITLSPEFRRRVLVVMEKLEKRGAVPVVYYGRRTPAQQKKEHEAGHSPTATKSWHLASYQVQKDQPGLHYKVLGEAADIVDARFLWQGPCADKNHPFWQALGAYAKEQGLEWGGDWKDDPDVAHVQLKVKQSMDFDTKRNTA